MPLVFGVIKYQSKFFVSVASLIDALRRFFVCEEKDLIAVSNTFCIAWFIFHCSTPWSGALGFPERTRLRDELMRAWAWGTSWEKQNLQVIESPEVAHSGLQDPWRVLLELQALLPSVSAVPFLLSVLEPAPLRWTCFPKAYVLLLKSNTACLIKKLNWSNRCLWPKQEEEYVDRFNLSCVCGVPVYVDKKPKTTTGEYC